MYIYVSGVGNENFMVKMLNLASLVVLRVYFGLQDAPFTHLFYVILHYVNLEEWPDLKWKQGNCTCYFAYI